MMNLKARAASHLAALSVILDFARPAPFQSFRHQGTQKGSWLKSLTTVAQVNRISRKCDKTDEIQIFLVVEIERPFF